MRILVVSHSIQELGDHGIHFDENSGNQILWLTTRIWLSAIVSDNSDDYEILQE